MLCLLFLNENRTNLLTFIVGTHMNSFSEAIPVSTHSMFPHKRHDKQLSWTARMTASITFMNLNALVYLEALTLFVTKVLINWSITSHFSFTSSTCLLLNGSLILIFTSSLPPTDLRPSVNYKGKPMNAYLCIFNITQFTERNLMC